MIDHHLDSGLSGGLDVVIAAERRAPFDHVDEARGEQLSLITMPSIILLPGLLPPPLPPGLEPHTIDHPSVHERVHVTVRAGDMDVLKDNGDGCRGCNGFW